MPAGGVSPSAFNLAEDVPLSAEGAAEWATYGTADAPSQTEEDEYD